MTSMSARLRNKQLGKPGNGGEFAKKWWEEPEISLEAPLIPMKVTSAYWRCLDCRQRSVPSQRKNLTVALAEEQATRHERVAGHRTIYDGPGIAASLSRQSPLVPRSSR